MKGEFSIMDNYIIKESANGYNPVSIEAALLTERKIFFTEEVNEQSCNRLIQQLLYFHSENPKGGITVYINSPGGSVDSGLAVYDIMAMVAKTAPLKTVCIGLAASMASLFFLAPEKENRLMLEHSRIMIHDPHLSGGSYAGQKAHQIMQVAESLDKSGKVLREIIHKSTGQDMAKIEEWTKADTYFTAEEAVENGLAGRIIESLEELRGR